jgi:hypothetical protein
MCLLNQPSSKLAPALAKHIEHWPLDRLIPYAKNLRKKDAMLGTDVFLDRGVW